MDIRKTVEQLTELGITYALDGVDLTSQNIHFFVPLSLNRTSRY